MFNLGLKKFYLILLVNYCLLGEFVFALRCYQCKYGANSLCTANDVVTVTCPAKILQPADALASSTVVSCGYAKVIVTIKGIDDYSKVQNLKTLTWRGCVNSAAISGAAATTPASALNYWFLGNTNTLANKGIQTAAYSYCTDVNNLCNKPRRCYRCGNGWGTVCNSVDTVLDECYDLNQIYCSSLTVTSAKYSCSTGACYWKGCLSSYSVTQMSINSNEFSVTNLNIAVGSTTNAQNIGIGVNDISDNVASIVSSSLNYCSTDGCNGASQMYTMFNLSIMIAALLLSRPYF